MPTRRHGPFIWNRSGGGQCPETVFCSSLRNIRWHETFRRQMGRTLGGLAGIAADDGSRLCGRLLDTPSRKHQRNTGCCLGQDAKSQEAGLDKFVQCKHSIYHRGGYVDPYGSFADMIEHCKQNNIQVIGVSPFNPLYATGMNPPNDPILNAVGVTPNEQLAWCAQLLGGVLMRTADETKHSEVFGAKMPGCPCPPAHLALMSNLHWFVNLEGLSGPYDGSIWPTSQEDMREQAALIPALFQSGDFVKMMGMVQQYLDSNKLDGPSFLQVISGMIDCAENNGHVVKEKVLRRLQADVERIQQERIEMQKNVRREATAKNALETSWGAANEVAKCIGVKDCQGYVENCRPTIPAIAEEMGRRLKTCGYVIGDNFLSNKSVKKLVAEMRPLEHTYDPAEVWVGEGDSGAHIVAPTVRGDQILWVCGGHETAPEDELFDSAGVQPKEKLAPCKPDVRRKTAMFCALAAVVRQMDQFVLDFLAPTCCPGLIERSDAMLAVYPPNGARFQKHIDNTMRDGRKLTVMTYFNEQWDAEKGGNLIVYHPEEGAIRVEPIAGRIVMFWSDKSKHAVEPNYGNTRRSMCIWYFDQDERREAVKRREVVGLDASSEATARNFVNDLLVLNEAFSSVKAKLCKDVKKLPKPALAYVEKVLCVDDLVSWVHGLEEVQLSYQRSLLHRMGV
eukprot:GEMP01016410.1.p1 GENE.GEMP01016410.1~~GEMP01016410.1.p1  ORF type:complete len:677 (+),score=129.33 GEMP01016410.1:482-2512(+)